MTSTPIKRTTVVVAEDHPIVRNAIVDLLGKEADLEAVAVCANGREALDAIERHGPDVALLNLRMPELSGLEVLARVRDNGIATRIILLTSMINEDTLLDATSMGLSGLFLKDGLPEDLIRCMREVANGRPYLPGSFLRLAREWADQRQDVAEELFGKLTERERQVVACLANGMSNKEIARRLDISDGTVKLHLHKVYQKLNVHNRASVAAMAVTHARYLSSDRGGERLRPSTSVPHDPADSAG